MCKPKNVGESKVAAKATQGVEESAVRLAQKSESALLKYEVKETAQAVEISLQKASLEKTTIAEKIQALLELFGMISRLFQG